MLFCLSSTFCSILFLFLINNDGFCSELAHNAANTPTFVGSIDSLSITSSEQGEAPVREQSHSETLESCLSDEHLPFSGFMAPSAGFFSSSPLAQQHFIDRGDGVFQDAINPNLLPLAASNRLSEGREPFSLQSQGSDPLGPTVRNYSQSSNSRSANARTRFDRRFSHQLVDREAAEVPDMADYSPNAFVRGFKRGMISVSDKASLVCKILGACCSILLAIGVGDYMAGGSFLSSDLQSKISILSAAGIAVFKTLGELLDKIKLRDECRLISYDSRDQFLAMRASQYPDIYYSANEIKDYLRQNNGFVTLPRPSSFAMRSFLFNVMCFFESVLGMCWAITAGLSSITTISGLSDQNLINLNSMATYRTLTIVFTATTAIIVLLDKNRQQLKMNCEGWIINYEMLIRYFISEGVTLKELSENVKPVPSFLINADLHNAMEQAANLSVNA